MTNIININFITSRKPIAYDNKWVFQSNFHKKTTVLLWANKCPNTCFQLIPVTLTKSENF